MGKSKATQQLFQSLGESPAELLSSELIVSVIKARGNNLYEVSVPKSLTNKLMSIVPDQQVELDGSAILLVEMPPKFRNTIFIKRGGYCVIDLFDGSSSKVKGEISNVVLNEKDWQKLDQWPDEYRKVSKGWDISDSSSDNGSENENESENNE